jgi:small-conductance mechanosensitive channel
MSFILDQVLHIIIAIIITIIIGDFNQSGVEFLFKISELTGMINLNSFAMIVLAYIIILSPTSVFIEYFFNYYFAIDEEETSTKRIGSLIGKLERVLILTLGLLGYYLAIGLVLTAKSIARFKQLDNKDFAEKYLVGTLLSLIFAAICIAVVQIA